MIRGSFAARGAALAPADLAAEGDDAWHHQEAGLDVLCQGEPAFVDPELARIASTANPAAAWLALYRRAGVRAAEYVHGRFACAVLDPSGGRLFLAVDRFGIDSLCHATEDGRTAFASRADQLPGVARDIDDQAIFDYLYFHMIPSPRTVYRGTCRLPPGHAAIQERGRLEVFRYWNPVFDEPGERSLPALRERFLDVLEQSVASAARIPETGAFLSGGTDSSTVAGFLGRVTGRPARTYSIGFDAAGYDEMAYARIAAGHFGTQHHEYYVTPADLVENIPRVVGELDQPFGNSSVLPAYCCARMARNDGVKRLLAGDGGDELFGGNTRYAKQRVFDLYGRFPEGLRRRLIEPALAAPGMATLPVLRKAASYVEQARTPMPDRMQMYNLLHRLGLAELFEPSFLERVDVEEPLRMQRDRYAAAQAGALINRMLAYDWKFTLADNDLPKVTTATRTAGVAAAFPLLDHRLVDFSLRLAPEQKLKGLRLRYFFKAALEGFLPDAIIRKQKHGFGLPFGPWAVAEGPLRSFALDALAGFRTRGYVRPSFIDALVAKHLPAHPGYYGELVWILMMLEHWLRRTSARAV